MYHPKAPNRTIHVVFEKYNQNWHPIHEYNVLFLRSMQNYLNDRLMARGHLFLNEVYDALAIKRTSLGAIMGWFYDPEIKNLVSFVITEYDEELLIDFKVDGTIYHKI